MQFYQNKQRHLWEVIIGSKNHNYNKRQKLHNAGRKLDFINTVLDENRASHLIKETLIKHHIHYRDIGFYDPQISKHRNQLVYKYTTHITTNMINPKSKNWTHNAACRRKYKYIVFLEKLQYSNIMYKCHYLQKMIKHHLRWCNFLKNSKKQAVFTKEIKSNRHQLVQYIASLKKNMQSCLNDKPFKLMTINNLTGLEYYIVSENNNDDGITSDKVAGLYVNDLSDTIMCNIDNVIINPTIKTIKQFKSYMLKHYHILTKTSDNNENALKYWHFVLLSSKKHQPDLNIRWISESKGLYPAYTAKNIKDAIHNNSVSYIHKDEHFHNLMNHRPKVYILFGDYGAKQTYIQKYLKKLLNITPIKHFVFPNQNSYCLVNMNLKSVSYYVHKYPKTVIPIKLAMSNQRTAFRRLFKHAVPYSRICSDLRKNKLMHTYGQDLIPNALKFNGNHINATLKKFTELVKP